MKTIIYFFLLILLYGCSFDNSSDLWRNENEKKLSKTNNDDNITPVSYTHLTLPTT